MEREWPKGRQLSGGPPDSVRHDNDNVDHVSQSRQGFRVFPDRLYIVTPISNVNRYRVRYELYRAFERHVEDSGGILYTVEVALRDREFEVTNPMNLRHIQLRTNDELWHKENMINIAISRLPADWKYVAWIDADILFARPDWCQETLHQLQHYKLVQMFAHAQDLGPNYEPLPYGNFDSFMYSYRNGLPLPYKQKGMHYPYPQWAKAGDMQKWHCGYAWAARREAIDHLGGLIDWAILGSADHNMAAALIGIVEKTVHNEVHPSFIGWMKTWQDRAERYIRRNVGYVDGLITHFWHGKKMDRGYVDRWKIIVDNKFNPDRDLKRDWQGLWQLMDHGDYRSIKLRDDLQRYFRGRNEDSIDTYKSDEK